jgi:hypothetical protein
MNSANDKYGSSLDRTLGAGKPVDPATRLSELLAQSLEELTRPFDPPRGGPARPVVAPAEVMAARPPSPEAAAHDLLPREPPAEPPPEETRIDADKALAELEAELFAAAKQVDSDAAIPHADEPAADDVQHEPHEPQPPQEPQQPQEPQDQPAEPAPALESEAPAPAEAPDMVPLAATEQAAPDADAARVVAKVRRLMLISMAVTMIAVGSVFGLIGYRIFKGEGSTAKTADKLPPSSPIPTDVTLSLPRGARVIQSAVSNDRLLITLEVDGKPEVRTFDTKTLQPIGRLDFSATP